ncbi:MULTISPECIES: regulatory iron-sulfur-containing complex subunit RicT [Chitinophagaceae]
MGCGNCGTGKPNGCKSNGGCSSGGCNRLNVFDWLANLPFSDPESNCKIVEVSFNKGSRKDYYRNTSLQPLEKGQLITVEGVGGFDVGAVSLTGELVRLQLKKHSLQEDSSDIKKILRISSEKDQSLFELNKAREPEIQARSRAIARQLNLQMKISEVEVQADGKKATFFYTADDRVDFREMIKIFASEFKLKVEMRQIGIRQEAGKVGGIGSCGRELCCSTWLTDFKSVTTTAARYQNLSINQTKLSGQCGRLKCCLNYELDTYLDALQQFPDNAETLQTAKGRAVLVKKDIFKNLMWYTLSDSSKQYPLTIERVNEIVRLNKKGEIVDELKHIELVAGKETVEVDAGFVDVVGQISLKSLERKSHKHHNKNHSSANNTRRNTEAPRDRNNTNTNGKPNSYFDRKKEKTNSSAPQKSNEPQAPQNNNRPAEKRNEQRSNRPQNNGPKPAQSNNRPPRQNNGNQNRPPRSQPPAKES